MIIASLLLIVAAAVLLVLGLIRDLDLLLVLSIAVSLVAAVALYMGARRSRPDEPGKPAPDAADSARSDARRAAVPEGSATRTDTVPLLATHRGASVSHQGEISRWLDTAPLSTPVDDPDDRPGWPLERRSVRGREVLAEAVASVPERSESFGSGVDAAEPMDEPPEQRTPRSDAELIARLPAEVMVVDGRPRYHVTTCTHLRGKEPEPLAVAEAVELGFTPCGWCQPDTVLLGGTPEG